MDKQVGVHYTDTSQIMKVVVPTIVEPLKTEFRGLTTLEGLLNFRDKLNNFKVLDPTCGNGNFLHVAYLELKEIEKWLQATLFFKHHVEVELSVSVKQLYGIEIDQKAVEETRKRLATIDESFSEVAANNIVCNDALFCEWPKVNVVIGNPPFLGGSRIRTTLGNTYTNRLRAAYKQISGRADYCVYFFRRAHDELDEGCRAGFIGTNTIRENNSRIAGLDYIVDNDGIITNAVSSEPWSGNANVHVSVVNWVKKPLSNKQILCTLEINGKKNSVKYIDSNLNHNIFTDIRDAKPLSANVNPKCCFIGQETGCNDGFLVTPEKAASLLKTALYKEVIHPYLRGNDLLASRMSKSSKYSLDLNCCKDITEAQKYTHVYNYIKKMVLPYLIAKKNRQRLSKWWQFQRKRPLLIKSLLNMSQYIACSRTFKNYIIEFIPSTVRPSAGIIAFTFEDYYSFGILQSKLHWLWTRSRCSTLKGDYRYTSSSVFDTFPWPQAPTNEDIELVSDAASNLRLYRNKVMSENKWGLRELYKTLDIPGKNSLREYHEELDKAVYRAYGFSMNKDLITQLVELNINLADQEAKGSSIVGPGVPEHVQKNHILQNIRNIKTLSVNKNPKVCFQGQITGNNQGFLITIEQAQSLLKNTICKDILHPYLTGNDLLTNLMSKPSRYSIDLNHCNNIIEAQKYGIIFDYIKEHVYRVIKSKAENEQVRTGKNTGQHQLHLQRWWQYFLSRPPLINALSKMEKYIVCSRVAKRHIFELISAKTRPDNVLQVFTFEDYYSFGILQSNLHWLWTKAHCSTLNVSYRYTSSSVFDTFPWPQTPSTKEIKMVSESARELRVYRNEVMAKNNWGLRKLYQTSESSGENTLKEFHKRLDHAVCKAYGFDIKDNLLKSLLKLNQELADKEQHGGTITGPGLPKINNI